MFLFVELSILLLVEALVGDSVPLNWLVHKLGIFCPHPRMQLGFLGWFFWRILPWDLCFRIWVRIFLGWLFPSASQTIANPSLEKKAPPPVGNVDIPAAGSHTTLLAPVLNHHKEIRNPWKHDGTGSFFSDPFLFWRMVPLQGHAII